MSTVKVLSMNRAESLHFTKINEFGDMVNLTPEDMLFITGERDGEEVTKNVRVRDFGQFFKDFNVDAQWFVPVVNGSIISWQWSEAVNSLPDIDIDFETSRRPEVQNYIVEKYKGHACQIASYGTNKVDNLINDLVKTYNELVGNTDEIKMIKKFINSFKNEEAQIDVEKLANDAYAKKLNKKYKNMIDAFCFMYNKVKYMGTHAAGVAISLDSIYYYTALRYDFMSY